MYDILRLHRQAMQILKRKKEYLRPIYAKNHVDYNGVWEHLRYIHRPQYGYMERYPANWAEITEQIKERDGYKCVLCGSRRLLEVDHIIDIAKGGTHDPENLRTLCLRCHAIKHGPGSWTWNKAIRMGVL